MRGFRLRGKSSGGNRSHFATHHHKSAREFVVFKGRLKLNQTQQRLWRVVSNNYVDCVGLGVGGLFVTRTKGIKLIIPPSVSRSAPPDLTMQEGQRSHNSHSQLMHRRERRTLTPLKPHSLYFHRLWVCKETPGKRNNNLKPFVMDHRRHLVALHRLDAQSSAPTV